MEEEKKAKIFLILVIISIMVLLISITGVGIKLYTMKKNDNIEKTQEINIKNNTDLINRVCVIKGNNSNLLYKNDYESDTTFSEKVIYLDEKLKEKMENSVDVDRIAYTTVTEDGECIKVAYGKDNYDSSMTLAYLAEGKIVDCNTNNIVKKAFDKNGNEIDFPKYDFRRNDFESLSDVSKFFAIFDINALQKNYNTKERTTEKNYIIGMYHEFFTDNNLSIIVILKKDNIDIDIENENQVTEFWKKYADYEIEEVSQEDERKYEEIYIEDKLYYHKLTNELWNGEYYNGEYLTDKNFNIKNVVTYQDYLKCINEIIEKTDCRDESKKIVAKYSDEKSNYVILSFSNGGSWCKLSLIDYIEKDSKIIIYGDEYINGTMASGSGYFIAIPTSLPAGTEIDYRECYSTEEISTMQNYNRSYRYQRADKPIIYLYPEKDEKINVKLKNIDLITTVYPNYDIENGWNVLAKQNGTLVDLNTNRNLYALYYESMVKKEIGIKDDGFVVKGEETTKFLEEKLAILGLTEREIEEFIIYWLPKLEKNRYNYIRFATLDEINDNMPLEINPNPDTIIRVLMTFKKLENPIDVKEQQLETPQRTGFVAVEWGGSEIQ